MFKGLNRILCSCRAVQKVDLMYMSNYIDQLSFSLFPSQGEVHLLVAAVWASTSHICFKEVHSYCGVSMWKLCGKEKSLACLLEPCVF